RRARIALGIDGRPAYWDAELSRRQTAASSCPKPSTLLRTCLCPIGSANRSGRAGALVRRLSRLRRFLAGTMRGTPDTGSLAAGSLPTAVCDGIVGSEVGLPKRG